LTLTPVAVPGPLSVSMTVNVIVSPTFGVESLTVFANARSACRGVSVALALLLAVLGSNWSAEAIRPIANDRRPTKTLIATGPKDGVPSQGSAHSG
jgi:hypothetical protein